MALTFKAFGKAIDEGKYGLAVINELGMVVYTVLQNATIGEVVDAEEWFNFSKLAPTEYLQRVNKLNGNVWTQNVDENNGLGNWLPAGF